MIVSVNVRYQPSQASWATSLLSDPPAKNGVVSKSIQDEIAESLTFLSGASYSADEVHLEFEEGSALDRPEANLRIRVQTAESLPENQAVAALDRIETLLRIRLPRADISIVLHMGSCSLARLSRLAMT